MRDDHDQSAEQHPDTETGTDTETGRGGDGAPRPGGATGAGPGGSSGPDTAAGGGDGLLLPTGPGIPDPDPDPQNAAGAVPGGDEDSGPDSGPDDGRGGSPVGWWDVGVLETAERAAEWLTRGPAPLRTPAVPGLPDGLDLRAMAVQMRSGRLTDSQLQAVWAEIISRAQTETLATGRGSTWTVAAAGLAVPELASITARVARTYPGPRSDLESAALAGYAAELHRATPLPGLLRTGAHGVPRLLIGAAESACRRLADTLAPAAWITGGPRRTGHAHTPTGAGPTGPAPDNPAPAYRAPQDGNEPPHDTPPARPTAADPNPPLGYTPSPKPGGGPGVDGRPAGPTRPPMITETVVSAVPVLVHVITGALAQAPTDTPTLDQVFTNLLKWITGILGAAAVVSLSVAGLRYVASQGDPEQIAKAKTAVKAAVAGFVLAALAPLVVEIVRSIVTK